MGRISSYIVGLVLTPDPRVLVGTATTPETGFYIVHCVRDDEPGGKTWEKLGTDDVKTDLWGSR